MTLHENLDNLILVCIFLLVVGVISAAAHMRVQAHKKRAGEVIATRRSHRASSSVQAVLSTSLYDRVMPPRESLASNILAGVVAGLKQSLGCVVFSSMIYNTCEVCFPGLQTAFSKGVSVNLVSSTIGVFFCTTVSKYGGLVSPQDIPAMLLSRIAEVLAGHVREEQLEATILACTWISASLFGVICVLAGYFRAGRVLRNIPCPVVDGFVAATGAMAMRSAFATLSMTPFHNLWPTSFEFLERVETWLHILAGLLSVFCIRYLAFWIKKCVKVQNKALNALLNPLCLLAPLLVFYLVLLCRGRIGEDLDALRSRRWVYPEVPRQQWWTFFSDCYPKSHYQQVAWDAILRTEVLFLMAMLQFLSLLSAVLCIVGMKSRIAGAEDMDLDREILLLGFQNLLIGAAGGNCSFQKLGMAVNIIRDGGTHKLADLVSGVFTALVFVSGVPVSPYIPKFFLAGIFLNLGIEFMKDHLLDKLGRMSLTDYGTTLVVVLLAMTKDMTWAVAGGCVLQVAILVTISSTLDPIRLQANSQTLMSTRLRTPEERLMLMHSNSIEVICLRGPLFFGIAAQLVVEVEDLLYNKESAPAHLILNLDQVTAIDHSAADAFMRIHQTVHKRGATFNIVGADEWRWLLVREGLIPATAELDDDVCAQPSVRTAQASADYALLGWPWTTQEEPSADTAVARWFKRLNEALEECENLVLEELEGEQLVTTSKSRRKLTGNFELSQEGAKVPKLFYPNSVGALADHDLVAMSGISADAWQELLDQCDALVFSQGEKLYERGDLCHEVYILTEGSVRVELSNGSARVLQALAVVGAEAIIMRFALRDESATVTSEKAMLYRLTQERLDVMRVDNKELYISFTDLRARALCAQWGASTE